MSCDKQFMQRIEHDSNQPLVNLRCSRRSLALLTVPCRIENEPTSQAGRQQAPVGDGVPIFSKISGGITQQVYDAPPLFTFTLQAGLTEQCD